MMATINNLHTQDCTYNSELFLVAGWRDLFFPFFIILPFLLIFRQECREVYIFC